MSFWDRVLRPVMLRPTVITLGDNFVDELVDGITPAKMYETQSALRTVTSFIGRNVAHLGVHVFRRDDGGDRVRVRDQVSGMLSTLPNPGSTAFRLWNGVVVDKCLYDRAYLWVVDRADGSEIYRLPPTWVTEDTTAWGVERYMVEIAGKNVGIPVGDVIKFAGYSPTSVTSGSAPIRALKDILREQIEGARYRRQTWSRGGRVSAVIERPAGSRNWSDAAREAFRSDWYKKYTGSGSMAGGTPILEDGMTLKQIGFSAHENQWVENLKLSIAQVASAYHVNPTMVGLLDNANFSNVREFRKMLYSETLGPLIADLEQTINGFLLPRLGASPDMYAEFNISEKLQGSFEEQATVMSTSVGAPWMTRNEARSRVNLPAVDGGDELVTPLNVLIGGQASPQDSGSQNVGGGKSVGESKKSAPKKSNRPSQSRIMQTLESHIVRQGRVVVSRMGAKADWWDGERWDRELAADLADAQRLTAADAARRALQDPDGYDPDQTVNYFVARATADAQKINRRTRDALQDALDSDDSDDAVSVAESFFAARADPDGMLGTLVSGMVTSVAGWGIGEAARQTNSLKKTWVVTSQNPRSEHASLDGETVSVDDTFSNGLRWPGDGFDPDEVAGCLCDMEIG